MLLGRRRILGESTTVKTALNLGLDIFAQAFWNDSGCSQLAEVGNGEVREKGKDGGKRRGWLAEKRDSNVVRKGPFPMMNDGGDH
jgi:hypothetical protein